MKSPKISIVSPSFNQGQFIEDAILSVLNQQYENFEHIIIDGGSTDNTIDILMKYPHLIWISEKDEGQSDAINKGFNRATGDIIGWLNTDDYYLEGSFRKIAENFKLYECDIVYGDVQFVDKNKKFTRKGMSRIPIKWLIFFHCYIHSAAFFFKREVLDKGIRIDPKIHITMDKDFFANIFYTGFKFKYIHETLTSFRWHENNKSLDTKEVRDVINNEGILILNKYSTFEIPNNFLTIKLYAIIWNALLPYKRILKWYSLYKTK
ncbi:glycosyltransferase family 2 protein [Pedobacter immunditicola]|uniref:glycosyltransferase family 2 protein n=1 Tax=Pedobacter immunditicola TaxID=3133440 RepID=UPI0030AD46FD